MNPYYFNKEKGMQRVKWFSLRIFKDSINMRLGKYEIIIYRPRIYKIRMEVY